MQLNIANEERADLLSTMLSLVKPEIVTAEPTIVSQPIHKAIPWAKRKQILEEEDRQRARIMRESDKLEKELLTDENNQNSLEQLKNEMNNNIKDNDIENNESA